MKPTKRPTPTPVSVEDLSGPYRWTAEKKELRATTKLTKDSPAIRVRSIRFAQYPPFRLGWVNHSNYWAEEMAVTVTESGTATTYAFRYNGEYYTVTVSGKSCKVQLSKD